MTREEAIHELQEDKRLYETEVCHAGDGSPDGRLLEAIDMAIEALSQPIVAKHFDIQSGYIYCSPQDAKNVKVVVRCKDCRYLDVWNLKNIYAVCSKHGITFEPFEDDTRTHLCSWGERREE